MWAFYCYFHITVGIIIAKCCKKTFLWGNQNVDFFDGENWKFTKVPFFSSFQSWESDFCLIFKKYFYTKWHFKQNWKFGLTMHVATWPIILSGLFFSFSKKIWKFFRGAICRQIAHCVRSREIWHAAAVFKNYCEIVWLWYGGRKFHRGWPLKLRPPKNKTENTSYIL